jgi:hypothetical protein
MREFKPRFVPRDVVREICTVLKAYRVREITGDRFSGGWVSTEFQDNRIKYRPSEKSKSELYLAALPLMLKGEAVLLDDDRLRRQFTELERRTHAGNRESVDHRRAHSHDDLCNVVSGALVLAATTRPAVHIGYSMDDGVSGRIEWKRPERLRITVIPADQPFRNAP